MTCDGFYVKEGRYLMYVGHRNPIIGVLLLTNGTVLLEAFLSGCVRENTYFYVFLMLLGEMVRCVGVTQIFQDVRCVWQLSCYSFFRCLIITQLWYLLDLLQTF